MKKALLFAGAVGLAYVASKILSGHGKGNGFFGGVGGSNRSSKGESGSGFMAGNEKGNGFIGGVREGGGFTKGGHTGYGFAGIGVEDEEVIGFAGKEGGNGRSDGGVNNDFTESVRKGGGMDSAGLVDDAATGHS